MKRRSFLKNSSAVTLPLLFNGMQLSALPHSRLFDFFRSENDKVLVLIQLNGGNDGLNTLIPLDQYDQLANARPQVLVPEQQTLKLNDTMAFHPSLNGFRDLYNNAKLGIVQSVGYPNQNRSHFRSMDIWQSGSPADEFYATGWLGRYFQQDHPGFPENYPNAEQPHPFAIVMGSTVSETCQGTAANFSMTLDDPFSLNQLEGGSQGELPDTPYGRELSFLRTTIAQTNAYSEEIGQAAEKGATVVPYPANNRLAQQLQTIALLISGGLRTKVFIASLGGFDTHANQVIDGSPTTGLHAELLQTLSESVAAFQRDLQQLGLEERVVGMTFSEFGRQIRANASFGTDHGTAAPLFLFGSCINPQVLGENPTIPNQVEVQEGVPMQYDFRDVYGSVLRDWFDVPESEVRQLLHPAFQYLPIISDCNAVTDTEELLPEQIQSRAFPNPFRSVCTIEFTLQEAARTRISLFNSLGAELRVLTDQRLPAGKHQLRMEGQDLAPGPYYYRIMVNGRSRTQRLVRQ